MSFKHLLPLLMLLPAVAFADGDRNFKIAPNQFKEGFLLNVKGEIAMERGKELLVSVAPMVPLRPNTFYYRQKVGPKEFRWYVGQPIPKAYTKLHAFSLKENYLKASEVVTMRFYASQKNKAFQDENDIYFDRQYIYSTRVPKLFFMKNGRWQQLKETDLPGMVSIDTTIAGLESVLITDQKKAVPSLVYPLDPGMYAFSFAAPGRLPYVDAVSVQEGQVVSLKPNLPMADTVSVSAKPKFTVSLSSVESATTLEEVENLYDTFVKELDANVSLVDTSAFAKKYPSIITPLKLSVTKDDERYEEYVHSYEITRRNAKETWRSDKLGGASAVSRALHHKLDSLQALPLRGAMEPSGVELVFEEVGGGRSVVAVRISFGNTKDRFEVSWVGNAEGMAPADFYDALQSGAKYSLTLANNKPVWIYDQGVMLGRFQYRYENLEIFVNDAPLNVSGKFELPGHIREQAEVQEWLNRPGSDAQEVSVQQVVSEQEAADSLAAAMAANDPMNNLDIKVDVPRILRDREHGTVALIDSGMFRYYGRVVSMSPFAIHTTEVTQQFFRDVMMKVEKSKQIKDRSEYIDPNKPVHNITWEDARTFCNMIGGDLPTEAQWEFAGRADNNEGALWNLDEEPDPAQYAVFRDNSYKMGEKNPLYGPQPVACKKPNAWNIYDMSGNVSEWTRDNYFMFSFWVESSNPTGAMMGLHKVYKGGSWKDKEARLNLTERDDEDPRYWSESIGFRCAFKRSVFEGDAKKAETGDAKSDENKSVESMPAEVKKDETDGKK